MKHLFKIVTVAAVAALTLSCASAFAKGDKARAGRETASSQTNVENTSADGSRQNCKGKGSKPELTEEEKAARAEKAKEKLAARLADGKITQEEYDAELARIESGDFKPDHKAGKGHSQHKQHDKAENEVTAE